MPRAPQGQSPSGDMNAGAVIAKIATGKIEDMTTEDGKTAAAVALGRMGGRARAQRLSKKRRKAIAKQAAQVRWSK